MVKQFNGCSNGRGAGKQVLVLNHLLLALLICIELQVTSKRVNWYLSLGLCGEPALRSPVVCHFSGIPGG